MQFDLFNAPKVVLPKIKLEVVVNDALLKSAIDAIKNSAHTGKVGDGKIFVFEVASALRIRTGDQDEDAV